MESSNDYICGFVAIMLMLLFIAVVFMAVNSLEKDTKKAPLRTKRKGA